MREPGGHTELLVMRLLARRPALSQRELATSLRMSLGKANYCLRGLIAKGLVRAVHYRTDENKLSYIYQLTPDGIAARQALTHRVLEQKVVEYEALRMEIEQLRRDSALGASGACP